MPRARLELARQNDPSQDFKSCASTSFATGAKLKRRGLKSDFMRAVCQSLKSMNVAKNPIQCAATLTRDLLSRQAKPLLFIFAFGCLISLQLEDLVRELGPTEDTARWVLQLSLGLTDLFEGILIFLVLSWGIPKVRDLSPLKFEKNPFAEPYLDSFFAEYLRMLATVLLFALMLLIPGLIAYCFLMFVPYIAIFSKPYRSDQVSALRYSYELTKKFFWRVFAVFIVTTALQLGLEFLPKLYEPLHNWPARVALMGVSSLIVFWTYSFMFITFEQAVLEDKDGINV